MNIIITGEKGYLSRKIGTYLSQNGHNISYISLRNDDYISCDYRSIDTIIHAAGIVPKKDVVTEEYYRVNRDITKRLYDCFVAHALDGHFIYLSSMATYGSLLSRKGGVGITCSTPQCPNTDYGKSKLLAEQYILSKNDKIRKTILRVPTLYDNCKQEYFDFYCKVLRKLPLIPNIKGNTQRSLLHIDNLCYLINEIVENRIADQVILPCDKHTPDVNEIIRYVSNRNKTNKRTSNLLGYLINVFYWVHPILLAFVGNSYYDDESAFKINGSSISDLSVNKGESL